MGVIVDDVVILGIIGATSACCAAEAWLHSRQGKQSIHDIAAAAGSVADAIAEGVK